MELAFQLLPSPPCHPFLSPLTSFELSPRYLGWFSPSIPAADRDGLFLGQVQASLGYRNHFPGPGGNAWALDLGPGWAWEFCPVWNVRKGDTGAVGREAEG